VTFAWLVAIIAARMPVAAPIPAPMTAPRSVGVAGVEVVSVSGELDPFLVTCVAAEVVSTFKPNRIDAACWA